MNNQPQSIEEALGHIDTRLSLVEREVSDLAGGGRWLKGIAAIVVLNVVVGAMAFARLSEQVETLNLDGMQKDVSTTLSVLGSHGNELESVRSEQARVRGVLDSMRGEMTLRTAQRFTARDGDRLESRVLRLEDWRIKHDKHEERDKYEKRPQ